MIENVTIIGTGLIGASVGLALRANGFVGEVLGWDASPEAVAAAESCGAITRGLEQRPGTEGAALQAGVIVLAGPVFSILEWMDRLAPLVGKDVLITDVGSTKAVIAERAAGLFTKEGGARFLPGHPMAGKERGGADLGEAELFRGRQWLFTPIGERRSDLELDWMEWVARFGARISLMDAHRHDELCAWVSHLPQMVATALAALLEERFDNDAKGAAEMMQVGGRALAEMTRLGASPYSMWRDIAHTNAEEIAASLHGLEQKLAHLRENLKTPELRTEFREANAFRRRRNG